MKNVIVGTAGHIDHGKSALVRALTGTDPDRWEEEKRRGITIDLGFAHLALNQDVRLGFVDVPGHERFVKNMLAGVSGFDVLLFVVAADESIKPQTREHFDICRLLAIPRGIVVLTKCDLVDREILDLVRLEVEEFVAGSFLAGAPIVAVSSTTGAGLDTLRAALAAAAASVPAKDASGRFRLPVDRVFSVRGFGTVVTGTLISGAVEREQEVEVYPLKRRLRVRGVEVHGAAVERACAGERTALNLPGVEPAELARGMVLSEPARFAAVSHVECRLELLPSAPSLKQNAPVHFHSGTAEIEAEVRLPAGCAPLAPGAWSYARIVLREPALLLPGDRFIIRRFSPVVTIGGGTVLDVGKRKHGRDAAARLDVLAHGSDAARLELLVKESRYGMAWEEAVARTGFTDAQLRAAAAGTPVELLDVSHPWLLDRAWMEAARAQLVSEVRAFHAANPLLDGIARQDLRARLLPDSPPFLIDAALDGASELIAEGEKVRLRSHSVRLQQDEAEARTRIEGAFEQAGLAAPAAAEVLAGSGVEAARARALFEILLKEKRLVRVGRELVFHAAAVTALRQGMAGKRGQRFSVANFKEWTGVSRKYAIPLLEFLDRERITRRDGDERVVL